MIVAIDGPAASGKGTLARRLAARLGTPHLDTGLLYRAVASRMIDRELPLADEAVAAAIAARLDMAEFADDRLRGAFLGEAASVVSAHAAVRAELLEYQRRFGRQAGGAVLDGRDIGTVVCPDADVKLFVTASAEERARRRHQELVGRGERLDFAVVLDDILRRDERDASRAVAPLRAAPDAVTLDTTMLDAEAAFLAALRIVSGAPAA